ncbi:CLIP domain-containing serine protease B8-like [Toxorhynchites rutilus septentrionalis]|uniref:CLIP domain-containing serine protease B8-like n=1 Tax=Toxorhynchites rutilus septentrionalis TaxID=329112 RepID=UPI00247A0635|nr:CLIP domain-containing serine protease B8-like [Toxorhynchites rutilus septentrionalis]
MFSLGMLFYSLVATLLVGTSLQQDDPPVWERHITCSIPNESVDGICAPPNSCPAFQDINQGAQLGTVGRISFIRLLQCDSGDETMICCPRSGSYRSPQFETNLPKRVRNATLDVGNRFGGSSDECGYQSFGGKIQGSITDIDEFPWAALLIYRNDFQGCGGVLISRRYVLTAAHCLAGRNYDRYGPLQFVRLREYDTLSDPDCMVLVVDGVPLKDCAEEKLDVRPRSIKIHPSYEPNSAQQHHDIGLIEVSVDVPYSDFLRPICLPVTNLRTTFKSGSFLSVCGWGNTNLFNKVVSEKSPIKMKASLPFVDHNRCEEAYTSQRVSLVPGQICAGGKKNRDSCAGDSGSPLMFFERKSSRWVLAGVVSQGVASCGTANRPGIYTNVREYLPWIQGITGI